MPLIDILAAIIAAPDRPAAATAALRDPAQLDILAEAIDSPNLVTWLREHRRTLGAGLADDIVRLARRRIADLRAAERLDRAVQPDPPPILSAAEILGRDDLPPGISWPGRYTVEPSGRIVRSVVDDEGEVSTFAVAPRPILATGILRDELGVESLHLEWRDGAKTWRREAVRASITQDPRALIALRDHGAPIANDTAREVCAWLSGQEESSDLPRATSSARLGWHGAGFLLGDRILLPGGEAARDAPPREWRPGYVRFGAVDAGAEQTIAAIRCEGEWEEWRAAVYGIRAYPLAMLAIWASLAAPLLGILPSAAPNLIVDWSGETSRGKTSALRLAASVWGQPDEHRGPMIASWSSTLSKVEAIAALCHHIPVLLDDSKEAKKAEDVALMLYQFAHGQGRGRALPGGGTRATSTWRSVLLSTGESPATSYTQDAGARARVLAIRELPFGPSADSGLVEGLRVALSDHYGHAGARAVRWLIDHPEQHARIRGAYDDRRRAYAAARPGAVAGRVAHGLALLEMGGRLAKAIGVPEPEGLSPVEAAIPHAEAGVTDTDRPTAAADSLHGWCVQHASEFWGRHAYDVRAGDEVARQPSRGWAGSWDRADDWAEIAIVPDCLDRVIRYHGHEPAGILDSWARRGWISGDSPTHRTRWRIISGERVRCYVVDRAILDGTGR